MSKQWNDYQGQFNTMLSTQNDRIRDDITQAINSAMEGSKLDQT